MLRWFMCFLSISLSHSLVILHQLNCSKIRTQLGCDHWSPYVHSRLRIEASVEIFIFMLHSYLFCFVVYSLFFLLKTEINKARRSYIYYCFFFYVILVNNHYLCLWWFSFEQVINEEKKVYRSRKIEIKM